MIFERIHSKESFTNPGDKVYRLNDIKEKTEVINIHDHSWLALHHESETTLDFALYDFAYSESDGSDIHVSNILRGSGTKDPLREMRHIWWNQDDLEMRGYTYYLNGDAVIKTFVHLKKYFDY